MHLSQGQLNLLETCPRQFQYVYLEQLGAPIPPEQQARLQWGSRFHLLMQQRQLGLPIESLAEADTELYTCFTAFVQALAQRLDAAPNTIHASEHGRSLKLQDYGLTVVYDLLMLQEDRAEILDWKTYARPQNPHGLAKNWQTRLYPYVLVETSHYTPEQVSLTYWFVHPQGKQPAQSLTFPYSTALHLQTHQDLETRLQQVTQSMQNYSAGQPLPQLPIGAKPCETCPFLIRCYPQGLAAQNSPLDSLQLDWQSIAEIPL